MRNMLEIKGKVNTAICYAKVIEEDAIEQIRTMCDYELTKTAKSASCQMFMQEPDVRLEQL